MNGFGVVSDLIEEVFAFLTSVDSLRALLFLLGYVFCWSGIAKVRNPALAALAMKDFEVVTSPRPGFGLVLGICETLLGLLLVSGLFIRTSALVAMLVLWTFSGLIARSLLQDRKFECFCFGGLDGQVSKLSLLRTVCLALLATLLFLLPQLSNVPELSVSVTPAIAGLALLFAIVLLTQTSTVAKWTRQFDLSVN
jgi:hypothetical protein